MWYWSRVLLKWGFLGGIFIWAAISLCLHIGLFWLERNPHALDQWASNKLGAPITIKHLETTWVGFGPMVKFHDVYVGTDGQGSYLAEAALDMTWQGLRVTVEQLRLKLLHTQTGQIQIEGLPHISATNSTSGFDLPFKQLRLHHAQLEWQDQQLGLAPIIFERADIVLKQQKETLHIRSQLHSGAGQAKFAANLTGSLNGANWSGNSYLSLQTLALANTLAPYLPDDYRLQAGYLDLEIWQQWQAAQPVHSQGRFSLRELPFATIKQWHGQFTVNTMPDNSWQLQLDDKQLGAITARFSPATEPVASLQLAAENIDIAWLRELLTNLPNNKNLSRTLNGLQAKGQLQQVRLHTDLSDQPEWTLNANIHQLDVQAWQDIPGIQGLNGHLRLQADRASVQLSGQNVVLDYPQLFRSPLSIDAKGTFYWLAEADGQWCLHSDAIQLNTPHWRSESRLQITQVPNQPTQLDLQAWVQDAQVGAISTYLPARIMGEELVEWVDNAFTQGSLETTRILLSGPVDSFPYHKVRNGAFEVLANIRNTPLAYQQGWPNLKDVDAQLHFHENSLDIALLKGRIYNSEIIQTRAQIQSLEPTSPIRIQGRADGALADFIQVLKEEALSDQFGEIAKSLKVGGKAALSLDLSVPLQTDIGQYALDGKLHFRKAKLALPEWNLALDNIQGILNFDLKKLQAKNIQAQALGSAISVDVLPYADHTLINAKGNFTQEAIAKQFPQIPLHPVEGSSTYNIGVEIPSISNLEAGNQLYIHSDLLGTQIKLPAPLGKTADSSRLFYLNLPLDSGGQQANHIRYGEQLDARFSQDWQQGAIRYATGIAQLSDMPGYQLNARFDELDMAAWQTALAQFPSNKQQQVPWKANIQAKQMAGQIISTSQKLDIQLQHAYFTFDTDSSLLAEPPDPATSPDPRQLPAITFACEDLQVNQAKLGRLTFNSKKTPQGLTSSNIQLRGNGLQLDAQGHWQQQTQARSAFNGKLQVGDPGQLLHDLGFQRHMHDANAAIDFDVNWPGHPLQAHKASLQGSLDLDIQDGRLAEVEPGILRVLSLLSLDALTRRLRFDFTDLLYEGYAFDRMHGIFQLKQGNAHTQNFTVAAASADLEIGGRIGFINKDFEQLIHATPKLDALFPIIGAATGGPIGGAAAFLLQQILAKQVDDISRFEYSVTGSWDEPKITPLENGGTQQQQELLQPRERKNLLEKLLGTASDTPNDTEIEQDILTD